MQASINKSPGPAECMLGNDTVPGFGVPKSYLKFKVKRAYACSN
jgi:hypothetical protein